MMHQSNILDPIQPTLSRHIWLRPESPEPQLKPSVAHWIKSHIYSVLEKAGYGEPHTWLRLFLTGSLTTYQYSNDSDCDVSLFINSDVLPEWSRAEMIGLMVESSDGVRVPGTPYELQCYVVGRNLQPTDLYKGGLRSGYDIDKLHWVVPPEHGREHDVQATQNGAYIWALEQADKMERLLRYEPDKAVQFWHQIHSRRMRDQKAGKGDYSDANIVYKFLTQRHLLPEISQVSGEHIAAWNDHFLNQIQPVAEAYNALPTYDPGAVSAWQELADDSMRRAAEIGKRLNVTVTDEPEPYEIKAGPQAMFNDINNGRFVVSRAYSEHPIWTPEQNVAFRTVHDVLGHHVSGGGFDWAGENQACGAHFPLLSPNAQRALMTECLGQTGAAIYNGGFGPQKVGFMNPLIQPAQQLYNRTAANQLDLCHRHIRHGTYRLPRMAKVATNIAAIAYEATKRDGGITISLDGQQPQRGYAFSTRPQNEETVALDDFSTQVVDDYIKQHFGELSQPNCYLGTWVNKDTVYLDVAQIEQDLDQAQDQASQAGQLALHDIATHEDIPVSVTARWSRTKSLT